MMQNSFVLAQNQIRVNLILIPMNYLNGNGNGTHQLKKKVAKFDANTTLSSATTIGKVMFQTAEGTGFDGTLTRMARHTVIFELYSPTITPKFSEAFDQVKVVFRGQ